jgi:leucyl-tRNA synthetase
MSKSKYNVVNPDDIVAKYGADTLRLYEMFLGPLEQSKPWSTSGVEGVAKFLRRFYRLFISDKGESLITDAAPTTDELRILHKTLQKVAEDIEKLSFNTIIPAFMIACNELTDAKCHKRAILEPLCIALAPLAPYIAEDLWHELGHTDSIHTQTYPEVKPEYLVKDSVLYPVSFNGKTRVKLELPSDFTQNQVEEAVLADADVQKYLAGASPKKVIVVPGRMVNLVI